MLTAEQALENKIRVQHEALNAVLDNMGVGCFEGATGTGKTKVALDFIETVKRSILSTEQREVVGLLVVPTEQLRDSDWPEEAAKWGVSLEGVKCICYNSLVKEQLYTYDFIIYDECHRITIPNLRLLEGVLTAVKRPYILGLTATKPEVEYPDDTERVFLLNTLLPTVYRITIDEAVDLGLVSDFEISVLYHALDSLNKNIKAGTVKDPFYQTEAAAYSFKTKSIQKATMLAQKDPKMEKLKMIHISKRAQFLYNLPSKFRLAKECFDKLQGQGRLLVFCGSINFANNLSSNVYHSESSSEFLDKFQAKEIDHLVTVKALNEGKNLTAPDIGLITQISSIPRDIVQRIGRLIRIRYNQMDFKARIVIIVTKDTADEKWFNQAIKHFDTKRIKLFTVNTPPLK
jgi:superfamily II DNA or RNA helicase